jgi:exopolyphosphatase/guanosine-5'-triphosphate,3'-diphosphate pyrophosphatase
MGREYIVAIDLGSNTLRVVKFECSTKRVVAQYEKIVKTADGLAKNGYINHEAIDRIICAIKEAQSKIEFSTKSVRAVTTEALRRASNSNVVLRAIKEATGVEFKIISGEEEAKFTLEAVKYRLSKLNYSVDSFVLVDIGGGSTELIFNYADEIITQSFPVGIVTIAQSYKDLETIKEVLSTEMFKMHAFCAKIYAAKGRAEAFVSTAGTPTTVAAMKLGQNYETYDAEKINGTSLHINELDFYLDKLLSLPFRLR